MISDFNYYTVRLVELTRTMLSSTAVKITVDIGLNNHWTDLVCGVRNTQLNETADSLKARYHKSHVGKQQKP